MQDEKIEIVEPNYWAIIPANIRYCEDLKPNEKLLYAEIMALTSKTGECWASDSYFSRLYKVSKQTVNGWVQHLVQLGFLQKQIYYKPNSKEIEKRVLRLPCDERGNPIRENLNTYSEKNEYPIQEKMNTPIKENLNTPIQENPIDNNINNNNINVNNINGNTNVIPEEIQKVISSIKTIEIRTAVLDWYNCIGKNFKITAEMLKMKLKILGEECNNDTALITISIKKAIANGWKNFYAEKSNSSSFKKKEEEKKSSFVFLNPQMYEPKEVPEDLRREVEKILNEVQ